MAFYRLAGSTKHILVRARCSSRWLSERRNFSTSRLCYNIKGADPFETRKTAGVHPDELEQLLAQPTWSVESLLPPKTRHPDAPQITSKQLHHLLRLSALSPPENQEQEQKMVDTLADQLHFVGKIQEVDTTNVEPLRAIRDETEEALNEQVISVESLQEALSKEKIIGKFHKRIQRESTVVDAKDVENWDVLGSAEKRVGNFFVVESSRPSE